MQTNALAEIVVLFRTHCVHMFFRLVYVIQTEFLLKKNGERRYVKLKWTIKGLNEFSNAAHTSLEDPEKLLSISNDHAMRFSRRVGVVVGHNGISHRNNHRIM